MSGLWLRIWFTGQGTKQAIQYSRIATLSYLVRARDCDILGLSIDRIYYKS
jgi:hypothetical protein